MKLKIGLALYSLMEELKLDYMGTLEKVAAMGFKYIEYVGTPIGDDGKPVATPEAIGAKVKELGLVPISSHVMMNPDSDIDVLIKDNLLMGSKAMILPFIAMESIEQIKTLAEFCNRVAGRCKENGMDFYYHNHFHEFATFDGKTALEILLEHTDPELVHVELDTYWVKRAGTDPVEMIRRLGSRCKRIHQKDMNVDASARSLVEALTHPATMENIFNVFGTMTNPDDIVCLGEGSLDIADICRTTEELDHAEYIIIELDSISKMTENETFQGRTPLECVEFSLKSLQGILEEI